MIKEWGGYCHPIEICRRTADGLTRSGFRIQSAAVAVHHVGWWLGDLGSFLAGQFSNSLLVALGGFSFGLSGGFRGLLDQALRSRCA